MRHGPTDHFPVNAARVRLIRLATILSVMAATVGCDQVSKAAARSLLADAHPITYLGGILRFTLIKNVGAFLSLGARLPETVRFLVFSVGGSLAILAGLYYLMSKKGLSNPSVLALSFVLGGAIGNQIDRFLFHGAVTDFLLLSLGPLHTGIFNFADMAVLFGAAFFLVESCRQPNPQLSPGADA
jgi:signal peptidase II